MKFFPMSCLMLGVIGISACGGGSSSGSNQTEAQVTPTENEQDVTSVNSNTNSKVEDQIYGYEFSYSGDGSMVTMYEYAVEDEKVVNNISEVVGQHHNRSYQYDVLTDKKKFKYDINVSNSKITYLSEKIIALTDTLASLQSTEDEELVSNINFAEYDISGKKITDVLALSGDFKTALDSLPSTQNTFGNQQSCKYIASENYSKTFMEYDEILRDSATQEDLNEVATKYLSKQIISGEFLGKPWISNVNKVENKSFSTSFILDNEKVYNVDYYSTGKTTLRFNGCEIFTKAQADFIVAAIKAVSNQP